MKHTIRTTTAELCEMSQNDLKWYSTPRNGIPYKAAKPNFRDDKCVATPEEIASAQGWDVLEEPEEGWNDANNEEIEYKVELAQ